MPTEDQTIEVNDEVVETEVETAKPDPKPAAKPVKESPTEDADKLVKAEDPELQRTRDALKVANKEAADRRHKLKEWEELSVDASTVKELLQAQRDAEIKKAEEEGRYTDSLTKIRTEAEARVNTAEARIKEIEAKLNTQLRDKEVMEQIVNAGGKPKILMPHIKDRVKLIETDYGYEHQVLDEKGLPTEISVADFVASFREDPELKFGFNAPKISGTGTPAKAGKSDSGKVVSTKPKADMSDREKRAFVVEHGIKAYKDLK